MPCFWKASISNKLKLSAKCVDGSDIDLLIYFDLAIIETALLNIGRNLFQSIRKSTILVHCYDMKRGVENRYKYAKVK
jgi:hypothetical protein